MIIPFLKERGCLTPALEECVEAGYDAFVRNMLLTSFQFKNHKEGVHLAEIPLPVQSDRKPVYLETYYPRLSITFLGREHKIQKIRQMLLELNTVVLQGIGGMGKSCLALKYVEVYANYYQHIQHVYFCKNIKQTILNLKFDNFDVKELSDEERYKKYMEFLHNYDDKTLLIIDNMNSDQNESPDFNELIKFKHAMKGVKERADDQQFK